MLKSSLRKLIPVADKLVSTQLVQRGFGRFVPIFMLHRMNHPDYGIRGQSVADLRKHLEHFRQQGYQAISLQQLGELLSRGEPPPYKSAVFTIDDGFIDHHDIAGPLFGEYDIPLTCFLVADFIDQKLWPWDDQISYAIEHASDGSYQFESDSFKLDSPTSRQAAIHQLRQRIKTEPNHDLYQRIDQLYALLSVTPPTTIPEQHMPMSWQQANALINDGHCIAAHTCSHRILSRLSDDESEREIKRSIQRVNEMVTDASSVFAYPTGRTEDFGIREQRTLQQLEIIATVSTVSKPYIYNKDTQIDIQQLPRLAMPSSHDDFIQYLGWIEFLKQKLRRH